MAEEMKRDEILEIIKHFKGQKGVKDKALQEFCKRKGFQLISEGQYDDYLFAYNHDARLDSVMPDILMVLSKLRNVPEFASHKERQAIMDANEAVSIEIAMLMETHEILYTDIDLILGGLSGRFMGALQSAKQRVDNMCGAELVAVAEKTFGSPLTIKALAEHNRSRTGQ